MPPAIRTRRAPLPSLHPPPLRHLRRLNLPLLLLAPIRRRAAVLVHLLDGGLYGQHFGYLHVSCGIPPCIAVAKGVSGFGVAMIPLTSYMYWCFLGVDGQGIGCAKRGSGRWSLLLWLRYVPYGPYAHGS